MSMQVFVLPPRMQQKLSSQAEACAAPARQCHRPASSQNYHDYVTLLACSEASGFSSNGDVDWTPGQVWCTAQSRLRCMN